MVKIQNPLKHRRGFCINTFNIDYFFFAVFFFATFFVAAIVDLLLKN